MQLPQPSGRPIQHARALKPVTPPPRRQAIRDQRSEVGGPSDRGAVQLLYANPKLNRAIENDPGAGQLINAASTIYFTDVAGAKSPTITKNQVLSLKL